jgi:hypothetical protein
VGARAPLSSQGGPLPASLPHRLRSTTELWLVQGFATAQGWLDSPPYWPGGATAPLSSHRLRSTTELWLVQGFATAQGWAPEAGGGPQDHDSPRNRCRQPPLEPWNHAVAPLLNPLGTAPPPTAACAGQGEGNTHPPGAFTSPVIALMGSGGAPRAYRGTCSPHTAPLGALGALATCPCTGCRSVWDESIGDRGTKVSARGLRQLDEW